ncbi:uncharacterized protein G2W53_027742 [Senna tora]|uniref:Uncharacterized protein n=1 Tax=Senna tora TaxID=362788 RepID=A0A834TJ80_9FABA|nr:uncharacterized protein G2W53_027742 [Senna tora]
MVHTQESEDPSFFGSGDTKVEVPTSSIPRGMGASVAFSGRRVIAPEEVAAGRVPPLIRLRFQCQIMPINDILPRSRKEFYGACLVSSEVTETTSTFFAQNSPRKEMWGVPQLHHVLPHML